MKTEKFRAWSALGVAISIMLSADAAAGAAAAANQLKQSIEKIQAILIDPGLKGQGKARERRSKLKEEIHERFDFNEMAKRSLGAQWKKRSPEEQKEFVRLFTELLENAYMDQIDSYNGEAIRYLSQRQEKNHAEVNTKVVNGKGEEFTVDYRLHDVNGDWRVIDVVIENISLVNNYRSQFSRVLSRSSFQQLVESMKHKNFSGPGAKS